MSLLDQSLALMRWKKWIVINTLAVAVASIVVSLLLPEWYRSTASIFPPEDENWSFGSMSSLVSVAALGSGHRGLPIWGTPSDVFEGVLKSRTVNEEIARRFNLMKLYKQKDMDRTLEVLDSHVKVKVGGEGIVRVRVEDRSPQRAAAMANAYVEILDRLNREKRNISGRQARIFLEQRLEQNRRELAAAEDSLRVIQETTGVLIPDEQLKSVITEATSVHTQLLMSELDLAVLRGQVGPDHPDRQALERQVALLKRKVDALENGPVADESGSLSIPLRDYPARSMALLRALREVKVQEVIYQFLSEQYENYRIEESRDTPTVQVLDPAVPATRKARPIRALIVAGATFLAFLASIAVAAGLEAISRLRRNDPERFEKIRLLARELRLEPLVDRL